MCRSVALPRRVTRWRSLDAPGNVETWRRSFADPDEGAREQVISTLAIPETRLIVIETGDADPPVDLAAEWEQGVAPLTRGDRQRRLCTGRARKRCVVRR
jgi:hypothetical protein